MTKFNLPYPDLPIERVIEDGNTKLKEAHDAQRTIGSLRGGNTGCVTRGGDVIGECHRVALARVLGWSTPNDRDSRFFFDQGQGLEDILAEKLSLSWSGPDKRVLREEEDQLHWNTEGTPGSGRPDFILQERTSVEGEQPRWVRRAGIELKTVCSTGTAHRVWFDRQPDAKHLCQAAKYAWLHNVPYTLVYYNTIRHDVRPRDRKKHGLEWTAKIPPYRVYFDLTFQDGVLYYRDTAKGTQYRTVITVDGLQDFDKLVVECRDKQELGPRVSSQYADGEPMSYRKCNYCAFADACNLANGDYEVWVREVERTVEEGK